MKKLSGYGKGRQVLPPQPKREEVEMLDGRVYFTHDNWQTVWKLNISGIGGARRVTGKEADLARYIAVAQSSAG